MPHMLMASATQAAARGHINTSPISVMEYKLCVYGGTGAEDTIRAETNTAKVSGVVCW